MGGSPGVAMHRLPEQSGAVGMVLMCLMCRDMVDMAWFLGHQKPERGKADIRLPSMGNAIAMTVMSCGARRKHCNCEHQGGSGQQWRRGQKRGRGGGVGYTLRRGFNSGAGHPSIHPLMGMVKQDCSACATVRQVDLHVHVEH